MKCKIDNDMWEHAGKVYTVHNRVERENSTAVTLTVEDEQGYIQTLTVANHQIEYV